MLAGPQRGHPHLVVQVRGEDDVDHVNVGPVQQLAIVGHDRGLRVVGLGRGPAGLRPLGDGRQAGVRPVGNDPGVVAAPRPVSHQAESDLVHDWRSAAVIETESLFTSDRISVIILKSKLPAVKPGRRIFFAMAADDFRRRACLAEDQATDENQQYAHDVLRPCNR